MAMSSLDFDNVKAEKEDALWRYNMERKLTLALRFLGFSSVFSFLLCSWFPGLIPDTVRTAGDFRRRFVSAFDEPLFTFVVVNVIIIVVYALSGGQKRAEKTDVYYDEYVSSRRIVPTPDVVSETEVSTLEKQIVLVEENAVAVSPVKEEERTAVNTVTESKISPPTVIVEQHKKIRTVAKKKKPEVKQYRRSRSMVSEPGGHERRSREFRRSETVLISCRREVEVSSGIEVEPARKSMDEMSSEEFQLIIDSFIAEKKKTLMQENTAAHYHGYILGERKKEAIVAAQN